MSQHTFKCTGCEDQPIVIITDEMTPSEQIEHIHWTGCAGIRAQFVKWQVEKIIKATR